MPGSRTGPLIAPPPWIPGLTWYQVYPLGALGAPRENPDPGGSGPVEHRLGRLVDWLDHVAGLGAGGVLLNPVFASLTHGYDTIDPFRIDPRLGDADDFAALVDAAHRRGLRVVCDGVFNHVSRAFPAFVEVRERGREASKAGWFRIDFDQPGPDGFGYSDFEGHPELVALNHQSPEVLDWAVAVAVHWLERGIDGWRLDAAYAVPPDFWSAFSARVRGRFPEAWLLGEMIHGDYAGFVRRAGLHSVTQYELYKAMWSSLNDANFFELRWALERHQQMGEVFVPLTFVGNHDVTRIVSQLVHPGHLGHALAALFTLPGCPSLYYGDELGWRGAKENRAGGDDAIRPPLPPAVPADPESAAVLDLHRRLVGFRRERPWLTSARVEIGAVTNQSIVYEASSGDDRVLVGLNLGDGPVEVASGGRVWQPRAGAPLEGGRLGPRAWGIFETT